VTPLRAFWWTGKSNFGDQLTPPILSHFTGRKVVMAGRNEGNKVLAVGSIVHLVRPGDTVWGSGWHRGYEIQAPASALFLAVRGPLTRSRLIGADVPEVYGDPGLLLPLVYNPDIEVRHRVGYVPHMVDKGLCPTDGLVIDVQRPWREVVNAIKGCERIVSSSLHGIVAAEAYGIPATWAVYSDRIIGGEFKFRDYLLGTGRDEQGPGEFPAIPSLGEVQARLLSALSPLVGMPPPFPTLE
jgi:pyruvyltransferase